MDKYTLTVPLLLISATCHGSGLYLYEIATEDVGLAGAGLAARAQDASTVHSNPAGLTRLHEKSMLGGVQALYGDAKYTLDKDSALSASGNSPGNVIGWFPASSFFYAQPLNETVSFGFGMYGDYGLGLDFGDWAGGNLIKKSTLVGVTLSPAVGWKISDKLSVGFAPKINYGFFSLTRSINNDDVKESDHDWAISYKLGLMYEFTDATRLGLTWEGKTEYNFDIHTKIYLTQSQDTAFDLPISAQVNTPQQIMLSLYHDVNKYWAIMGNLGWQDWSQYSSSKVIVAGVDVENNGKLKDTWHSSVGLQYRPIEEIRINTGVAYDSSFYHSQHDTSLTMPSGAAWRIGSGIQYQISPTSNIGFAIEYLTMESSYVNSSLFRGKYNNPDMLFFSANMGYKF